MKHLKKLLLLIWIIPCMFVFNACSFLDDKNVYITNISITSVEDDSTVYTIHYSDGTTETVPVENEDNKYIVDIKKTSKIDKTTTYTIYYSDNSTSILTIEDGQDGVNGTNGTNGTNGSDGQDGEDGKMALMDKTVRMEKI